MIEESAQVVALEEGYAWVETRRKSACDSCSVNKGCGSAVLQKVIGNKRSRLQVINTLDVYVGDEVVIGIQDNALVRGSMAVYAVPLLAMIVVALLGEFFSQAMGMTSELFVILSAGMGLAAGFFWLRHFTKKISNDRQYQAVILRMQVTDKSVSLIANMNNC